MKYPVKYPTSADLARFRARIALTNKSAGYHYLAIARATRGQPWNTNLDGESDFAHSRSEWPNPTIAHAGIRWSYLDRLAWSRYVNAGPTERQLNEAWGV